MDCRKAGRHSPRSARKLLILRKADLRHLWPDFDFLPRSAPFRGHCPVYFLNLEATPPRVAALSPPLILGLRNADTDVGYCVTRAGGSGTGVPPVHADMAGTAVPRLTCHGHPCPCPGMARMAMAQGRSAGILPAPGRRRIGGLTLLCRQDAGVTSQEGGVTLRLGPYRELHPFAPELKSNGRMSPWRRCEKLNHP